MIAAFKLTAEGNAALNRFAADVERRLGSSGYPLLQIGFGRSLLMFSTFKEAENAAVGLPSVLLLAHQHKITVQELDEAEALVQFHLRDPQLQERLRTTAMAPVEIGGASYDWHLASIKAPHAWQQLGGRDAISWKDIRVGHLDTGFLPHPALGFVNGRSAWVDTIDDRDFFEPDRYYAQDPLTGAFAGHGTRTMSTLAGADTSPEARHFDGNATFTGYFGVAPRVPVLPVRVSDSVWVQDELNRALPAAINYLVDRGCPVLTMSMGSPYFFLSPRAMPEALKAAIDRAYARGVIFICAAGNNIPNDAVVFPARSPRTIAVAGVATLDRYWVNSSKGIQVDIAAPADPIRRGSSPDGRAFEYGWGDGTSYATAIVAGAAALWVCKHGLTALKAFYPEGWQRVAAFRLLLQQTARRPANWDHLQFGAGVVDCDALLQAPLPAPATLRRDDAPFET